MNEYPKQIVVDGVKVTVHNADEEAKWTPASVSDPEAASVPAPDPSDDDGAEDAPKKKGAKKK